MLRVQYVLRLQRSDTNLHGPPPLSSVNIMVEPAGAISVGVVPLRRKDHVRCKGFVAVECTYTL